MRPLAVACGVLAVSLAGALVGWRRSVRTFVEYRTEHAPSVPLAEGACPRTGLVARWALDRAEGVRFRDDSGLGNDLVEGGSFAPFAALRFGGARAEPGRVGGGVGLGGHQWFVGPNTRCFATRTLSAAAWVRLAAAVDVPTVVAKSTWPADGFWLLVTSAPPFERERRLQLGIASDEGVFHVDAGYELPLGEWHHVAVSVDGDAHEVRFFVDGRPHGEVHRGVPEWRVNTTHPIVVGDYDDTGRWPWSGSLDDVRVWNRVVTDAEVADAFAGRAP